MSDDAPTPQTPENAATSEPTPTEDASHDRWAPPTRVQGEPTDAGTQVFMGSETEAQDAPRDATKEPTQDPGTQGEPTDAGTQMFLGEEAGAPDEPTDAVRHGFLSKDTGASGGPVDAGPSVGAGVGAVLAGGEGRHPQDRVPSPVHDQQTVVAPPDSTPPPADSAPQPWANPFVPPVPDGSESALGSYPPPNSAAAVPGAPNPFVPPVPDGSESALGSYPPPNSAAAVPAAPNPFAPPTGPTPYPQDGVVPPPPIAPDGPGQVPYGYGYSSAPGTPGYYGWPGVRPPSNAMGTSGLVLGIISVVGFCLWPATVVLGVLGVIFGVIGRRKASRGEATNAGPALAGIICGAAGIVLGIGILVLVLTVGI